MYDTDGTTAKASLKVTIRNERTNESISMDTNSSGQYALDCGNFTSGYANGDIITIFTLYSNYEDYESHTIIAGGGHTQNLTLELVPASENLRYFTVQDFYDYFSFNVGDEGIPSTNDVVKIGLGCEAEIDTKCNTVWSNSDILKQLDSCDATTGWTASTDAVAVAVTTTDGDYKYGSGALDLGKDGATEAFFYYYKTLSTSYEFNNKTLFVWVYIKTLSDLASAADQEAIRIKFGSDSSNYYYDWIRREDLIAGWNLIKLDQSTASETGTPLRSDCDYLEVYFTVSAASSTVTSGDIIMDEWQLARNDCLIDEYIDVRNEYHNTYFCSKSPIDTLLSFRYNSNDEGEVPTWNDLELKDDEVEISKDTGRVLITNDTNYPVSGHNQVNVVYTVGEKVPKDIRKLSILMTGRDLSQSAIGKALISGNVTGEFAPANIFDTQIDSILNRYRRASIFTT